jgi:hypothetical protein
MTMMTQKKVNEKNFIATTLIVTLVVNFLVTLTVKIEMLTAYLSFPSLKKNLSLLF